MEENRSDKSFWEKAVLAKCQKLCSIGECSDSIDSEIDTLFWDQEFWDAVDEVLGGEEFFDEEESGAEQEDEETEIEDGKGDELAEAIILWGLEQQGEILDDGELITITFKQRESSTLIRQEISLGQQFYGNDTQGAKFKCTKWIATEGKLAAGIEAFDEEIIEANDENDDEVDDEIGEEIEEFEQKAQEACKEITGKACMKAGEEALKKLSRGENWRAKKNEDESYEEIVKVWRKRIKFKEKIWTKNPYYVQLCAVLDATSKRGFSGSVSRIFRVQDGSIFSPRTEGRST